ncbi:MAG: DUF1700 domain-containing protein [bacterium]|nr:DUF1700 domain-containing protein [bacterium]
MNKEQFLFQLEQLLLDISENERKEAVEYYRSYFEDAGTDDEAKVIEELGSPKKVAASIKEGLQDGKGTVGEPPQVTGSYYDAKGEKSESKKRGKMEERSKWILILIVAVFTFPVWIGVVGGAFGVLAGAIAAVIGILVAVIILSVVGLIGGIPCMIYGIVRMVIGGFGTGLLTFGMGALLFAAGLLCTGLSVMICGQFIPWALRSISNLFHNGLGRRKKVGQNE